MSEELLHPFRRAGTPDAKEAEELFLLAYRLHMQGRLDEAIQAYTRSIERFPTAEAHTFRGWAYSMQGDLQKAIQDCYRAIEVDPDFGNPYNDIGAYLIELGRPDEAVPWLEKAKTAPRYDPRHFPYTNLARVYLLKDRPLDALRELREALRIFPDNPSARHEMLRLLGLLN